MADSEYSNANNYELLNETDKTALIKIELMNYNQF